MKKIFFIFIVIPVSFLPLFLFHNVYNYDSQKTLEFSEYTLSNDELLLLQDGDIILRHGYGFVSDMIVDTKNEKFKVSHCAVISKDTILNKFNVIHSVSQTLAKFDGVQSQPLKIFLNDCQKNSIIITRYKNSAFNNTGTKISERAKYYLNKKVPFDNKFDLFNNEQIYCTELIYLIIKDEFNDDIFSYNSNNDPKDIDFAVFTDTSHFNIIINHHLRNNP